MDDFEPIERFDRFAALRNKLREVGAAKGEWAGIPMPLDGEQLVVEPSYPYAAAFTPATKGPPDGVKLRNTFYSHARRCDIHVLEENGKIDWAFTPAIHHLDFDLHTLGCADAWGIEQEANAVSLLATLVRHHAFKQYLITGMFLESSVRTGIMYLFRRLKPTVAMKADRGRMRVMCALCMHPIAFYQGTWAGAMCPTDDVVAHLMLMRGDEPMFWKRCSQHAAHRPEAGL